ncbi:unnamed protein product [Musa acuminata var. zebrina]
MVDLLRRNGPTPVVKRKITFRVITASRPLHALVDVPVTGVAARARDHLCLRVHLHPVKAIIDGISREIVAVEVAEDVIQATVLAVLVRMKDRLVRRRDETARCHLVFQRPDYCLDPVTVELLGRRLIQPLHQKGVIDLGNVYVIEVILVKGILPTISGHGRHSEERGERRRERKRTRCQADEMRSW